MRKSAETLKPTRLGDDEVGEVPGSRLVIAKGPKFLDEYMTQFIMPRRFDTAQLALSAMIQSGQWWPNEGTSQMAEAAFKFADALLLAERPTCDAAIDQYWERYMTRDSKTGEVMDRLVEESKDYSL